MGLKAPCPPGGYTLGHAPQKIFEITKFGKTVSSDLMENINTQAFIIFIRKKVFNWTVQGSLLS